MPEDGTSVLAYDQKTHEMAVVSQPKGYAIGRWEKLKNGMYDGSFMGDFEPTHWTDLPMKPNGKAS
jgi:hypothetical protein